MLNSENRLCCNEKDIKGEYYFAEEKEDEK